MQKLPRAGIGEQTSCPVLLSQPCHDGLADREVGTFVHAIICSCRFAAAIRPISGESTCFRCEVEISAFAYFGRTTGCGP